MPCLESYFAIFYDGKFLIKFQVAACLRLPTRGRFYFILSYC